MNGMRMKNREKGSIKNTEKINTLHGRWFSGKMKTININNGLTIKQGCMVKIGAESTALLFLVYVVDKVSGNKWFPTVSGDYPLWHMKPDEKKRFHLELREVNLNLEDNNSVFKDKLVDGINVTKK